MLVHYKSPCGEGRESENISQTYCITKPFPIAHLMEFMLGLPLHYHFAKTRINIYNCILAYAVFNNIGQMFTDPQCARHCSRSYLQRRKLCFYVAYILMGKIKFKKLIINKIGININKEKQEMYQ